MRFSLRVNNDLSPSELSRLAILAERFGFDQLWVSNDLLLRSAPALIGALAVQTSTIGLGIAILNPYTMHPTEIAMVAATLQELTGGRFLLGLGAGSSEFLGWAGISRDRPVATTAASVTALRAMLGHSDVDPALLPDWFGPEARLRFALPTPVPVYVGAMGPVMLDMAGRVADGALPLLYPPENYVISRAQILGGVLAADRDPASFDLPACFWVSVSDDGAAARDALAEKLAYYGPSISPAVLARVGLTPDDFALAAVRAQDGQRAADLISPAMLRLGVAGPPSEVVDRCVGLYAAGATHLSFGPPLGPSPLAAVEALGTSVLPELRTLETTPA